MQIKWPTTVKSRCGVRVLHGFYTFRTRGFRGLWRYYRVAWGVPGIASVAVGGRVDGRKVRGGITTLLRALH